MKHNKNHYRKINIDGFTWSGFWDGFHYFSKRQDSPYGYWQLKCTEGDIEDGNLIELIKLELSR